MSRFAVSAVMALICCTGSVALAQSSGGAFEIIKTTIDSGGGRSSGGAFTVTGTIGQPDASLQTASGGPFQLTGGFWASGEIVPADDLLFSDSFESP